MSRVPWIVPGTLSTEDYETGSRGLLIQKQGASASSGSSGNCLLLEKRDWRSIFIYSSLLLFCLYVLLLLFFTLTSSIYWLNTLSVFWCLPYRIFRSIWGAWHPEGPTAEAGAKNKKFKSWHQKNMGTLTKIKNNLIKFGRKECKAERGNIPPEWAYKSTCYGCSPEVFSHCHKSCDAWLGLFIVFQKEYVMEDFSGIVWGGVYPAEKAELASVQFSQG